MSIQVGDLGRYEGTEGKRQWVRVARTAVSGSLYATMIDNAYIRGELGVSQFTPARHAERWATLLAKRKALKVPGVFNVGDRVRVKTNPLVNRELLNLRSRGLTGHVVEFNVSASGEKMPVVSFANRRDDYGYTDELEHL